ncbi:hypothetical protein VNI00_002536 [Paramarasmius palmivorus]|uniref:C2H2-type domain-containing protein n=1 Tax=Paramarasmius palmivorus TaxID=297713 RepID=A0AAW0DUQ6_9AGAR
MTAFGRHRDVSQRGLRLWRKRVAETSSYNSHREAELKTSLCWGSTLYLGVLTVISLFTSNLDAHAAVFNSVFFFILSALVHPGLPHLIQAQSGVFARIGHQLPALPRVWGKSSSWVDWGSVGALHRRRGCARHGGGVAVNRRAKFNRPSNITACRFMRSSQDLVVGHFTDGLSRLSNIFSSIMTAVTISVYAEYTLKAAMGIAQSANSQDHKLLHDAATVLPQMVVVISIYLWNVLHYLQALRASRLAHKQEAFLETLRHQMSTPTLVSTDAMVTGFVNALIDKAVAVHDQDPGIQVLLQIDNTLRIFRLPRHATLFDLKKDLQERRLMPTSLSLLSRMVFRSGATTLTDKSPLSVFARDNWVLLAMSFLVLGGAGKAQSKLDSYFRSKNTTKASTSSSIQASGFSQDPIIIDDSDDDASSLPAPPRPSTSTASTSALDNAPPSRSGHRLMDIDQDSDAAPIVPRQRASPTVTKRSREVIISEDEEPAHTRTSTTSSSATLIDDEDIVPSHKGKGKAKARQPQQKRPRLISSSDDESSTADVEFARTRMSTASSSATLLDDALRSHEGKGKQRAQLSNSRSLHQLMDIDQDSVVVSEDEESAHARTSIASSSATLIDDEDIVPSRKGKARGDVKAKKRSNKAKDRCDEDTFSDDEDQEDDYLFVHGTESEDEADAPIVTPDAEPEEVDEAWIGEIEYPKEAKASSSVPLDFVSILTMPQEHGRCHFCKTRFTPENPACLPPRELAIQEVCCLQCRRGPLAVMSAEYVLVLARRILSGLKLSDENAHIPMADDPNGTFISLTLYLLLEGYKMLDPLQKEIKEYPLLFAPASVGWDCAPALDHVHCSPLPGETSIRGPLSSVSNLFLSPFEAKRPKKDVVLSYLCDLPAHNDQGHFPSALIEAYATISRAIAPRTDDFNKLSSLDFYHIHRGVRKRLYAPLKACLRNVTHDMFTDEPLTSHEKSKLAIDHQHAGLLDESLRELYSGTPEQPLTMWTKKSPFHLRAGILPIYNLGFGLLELALARAKTPPSRERVETLLDDIDDWLTRETPFQKAIKALSHHEEVLSVVSQGLQTRKLSVIVKSLLQLRQLILKHHKGIFDDLVQELGATYVESIADRHRLQISSFLRYLASHNASHMFHPLRRISAKERKEFTAMGPRILAECKLPLCCKQCGAQDWRHMGLLVKDPNDPTSVECGRTARSMELISRSPTTEDIAYPAIVLTRSTQTTGTWCTSTTNSHTTAHFPDAWDKSFGLERLLNEHRRNCHRFMKECTVCGIIYLKECNWDSHLANHEEWEVPYVPDQDSHVSRRRFGICRQEEVPDITFLQIKIEFLQLTLSEKADYTLTAHIFVRGPYQPYSELSHLFAEEQQGKRANRLYSVNPCLPDKEASEPTKNRIGRRWLERYPRGTVTEFSLFFHRALWAYGYRSLVKAILNGGDVWELATSAHHTGDPRSIFTPRDDMSVEALFGRQFVIEYPSRCQALWDPHWAYIIRIHGEEKLNHLAARVAAGERFSDVLQEIQDAVSFLSVDMNDFAKRNKVKGYEDMYQPILDSKQPQKRAGQLWEERHPQGLTKEFNKWWWIVISIQGTQWPTNQFKHERARRFDYEGVWDALNFPKSGYRNSSAIPSYPCPAKSFIARLWAQRYPTAAYEMWEIEWEYIERVYDMKLVQKPLQEAAKAGEDLKAVWRSMRIAMAEETKALTTRDYSPILDPVTEVPPRPYIKRELDILGIHQLAELFHAQEENWELVTNLKFSLNTFSKAKLIEILLDPKHKYSTTKPIPAWYTRELANGGPTKKPQKESKKGSKKGPD